MESALKKERPVTAIIHKPSELMEHLRKYCEPNIGPFPTFNDLSEANDQATEKARCLKKAYMEFSESVESLDTIAISLLGEERIRAKGIDFLEKVQRACEKIHAQLAELESDMGVIE